MSTTTAAPAPAVTDEQRAARLALAESLWQVKKDLNRDDVHGVLALATSGPGSAYAAVTEALGAVILTLVDDDHDRADEIMFQLVDNYESVAYNVAYEAAEHARRAVAYEVRDAARAARDARLADERADLALPVPHGWTSRATGEQYVRALEGITFHVTGEREVTARAAQNAESALWNYLPSDFLDNGRTGLLDNAHIASFTFEAVLSWD